MFKNPGKKIKGFAKVVFWLGIIGSVSGAFAAAAAIFGSMQRQNGGLAVVLAALAFVLTIALGILISWLETIFIYGLGQLIDNSDILVENTNRSVLLLNSQYTQGRAAQAAPAPQFAPAPQPAPAPQSASVKICPVCGTEQPAEQNFCRNCGTRLG